MAFVLIAVFLAVNASIWIFVRERWRRTEIGIRFLKFISRLMLWNLSVRVNPIGLDSFRGEGNALIASNHLSYLDVVVISSKITTCFVTSVEIRETPVLGQLCLLAGCLFVERRKLMQIHREIGELQKGLERGLNVTIFPEATSANHEQILRFRRPLFAASTQSGRPVVPVCVNYRVVGKEPISLANRDLVCWYSDMPFASHLWSLCGLGNVNVDLVFLPAAHPKAGDDVGETAAHTQSAVESVFIPVKA